MRNLWILATLGPLAAGLSWPPIAWSDAHAATPPLCHGRIPTITGTSGDDTIIGTDGPDVIVGLDGNDTIYGGEGDDVICGNDGGDTLSGGRGNDKAYGGYNGLTRYGYYYYEAGDSISGGRGNDLIDLGDDPRHAHTAHIASRGEILTYADSATGVHIDLAASTATGEGTDTIVKLRLTPDQRFIVLGSPESDVIKGTASKDEINPMRGDDAVWGRGGGDRISEDGHVGPKVTRNGDDTYHGGDGHDRITSVRGHDTLLGEGNADKLVTLSDGGVLQGGPGPDFLRAGDAHVLDRTATLVGGSGTDHLQLFNPADGTKADGGKGTDRLTYVEQRTDPVSIDLGSGIGRTGALIPVTAVERWDIVTSAAGVLLAGTPGPDDVLLRILATNDPVSATFGGGADRFRAIGRGPLTVSMGSGSDHLWRRGTGRIDARLGSGDDLVETHQGFFPGGTTTPVRRYDGGMGTDTAHLDLDLPNNHCTSIEKGNCP